MAVTRRLVRRKIQIDDVSVAFRSDPELPGEGLVGHHRGRLGYLVSGVKRVMVSFMSFVGRFLEMLSPGTTCPDT